jgi:alpha-mannosidase
MRVGYLPDSFGHPGSLPAVLSGFGIESASMMRGPGPELERPFFSWTAKDGSRVLLCSLIAGYGNGADLDADAATISQQLSDIRAQQDSVLFPDVPLLVMNGTDHRPITAGLPDALAGAGLADRARIGSLAELISLAAERLPENLPQWQGELRSPLRSPILAGCTSARSWIKQEDQAVSTLLEREAEPLAALAEAAGCGSPFPAVALDLAWTHFLQNQPHDSICGCSIDAVHDDMRFRYAQARGIAENIVGDAAAALAARLDTSAGGVVALNPGPSRSEERRVGKEC